jgi:hypothetical protein
MGKSGEKGPIIVTLFDPNTPTGKINGEMASGTITAQNLVGPMKGEQLSDFLTLETPTLMYTLKHILAVKLEEQFRKDNKFFSIYPILSIYPSHTRELKSFLPPQFS